MRKASGMKLQIARWILSLAKTKVGTHKRQVADYLARSRHLQNLQPVTDYQVDYWLPGLDYLQVLAGFHQRWSTANPRYRYLELGTCAFRSLLIAKGQLNVGVDPQPSNAFRFNEGVGREYR